MKQFSAEGILLVTERYTIKSLIFTCLPSLKYENFNFKGAYLSKILNLQYI